MSVGHTASPHARPSALRTFALICGVTSVGVPWLGRWGWTPLRGTLALGSRVDAGLHI